jgi:DNA recombination protein RmuC
MFWIATLIFMLGFIVLVMLVLKISAQMNQQLNAVSQLVNDRLKETSAALQDANKTVGERLDSATKVFGEVQKSLGKLEETNKQIYAISQDISSLQDLLRAPKFRGEIGETLLNRLLEDILPKENFKIQHRFKSGDVVDAAILIGSNLISIDAKFPLENFKRFMESSLEDEQKSNYRVFVRDVKLRIDEVSSKYIVPDEGTFDFALMYIPAEAVYYQINRDEELSGYAHSRNIVFVSPNTFYAYLQAILYGLRGVNIQRNIVKIFSELGRAQLDFKKFQDDFETIGGHLTKASNKYIEAKDKLLIFSDKLSHAAQIKQVESSAANDR